MANIQSTSDLGPVRRWSQCSNALSNSGRSVLHTLIGPAPFDRSFTAPIGHFGCHMGAEFHFGYKKTPNTDFSQLGLSFCLQRRWKPLHHISRFLNNIAASMSSQCWLIIKINRSAWRIKIAKLLFFPPYFSNLNLQYSYFPFVRRGGAATQLKVFHQRHALLADNAWIHHWGLKSMLNWSMHNHFREEKLTVCHTKVISS